MIPPSNTRWIFSNRDLPQEIAPAMFAIEQTDGSLHHATVSKRLRQVLETLIISPVYCASPIRLSYYVDVLRDTHGLKIETLWFSNNDRSIKTRYGVYVLRDVVSRQSEAA